MHISGQLIPTIRQLNTWPRFRLRLFAEGALVGVFAGLTAGFFRFALEKGSLLRLYIFSILIQNTKVSYHFKSVRICVICGEHYFINSLINSSSLNTL